MAAPIASVNIAAIGSDGDRFEISLQIGLPFQRLEYPDEWLCSVSLEPLYPQLRDQIGSDAFQALCLALRLAFTLLASFKAGGGKLLCSDGTEFPLEAYLPVPKSGA